MPPETFKLPTAELIAANKGTLALLERSGPREQVLFYVQNPNPKLTPIRVRLRDKRIFGQDAYQRLCAAHVRGDAEVMCARATMQEELSA